MGTNDVEKPPHTPVLVREVVELLAAERGGFFVDATVGAGGHTLALLEASPDVRVLALDRDPDALALAADRLARFGQRVRFVAANFGDLARERNPDSPLADISAAPPNR